MTERKKLIAPKHILEKYGSEFPIWSYSRLSTFHNCLYEYYLGRVKKFEGEDNIYSLCGTCSHDILEKFYNNEIKYEDMVGEFEDNFLDVEVSDYKFSSDEEKNDRMTKNYKGNMIHFFKNHIPVKNKVLTEREVWVEVGDNVFIGYVDAIHKENDIYIITDYKTSSISEFKGEKLKEKQKQLLLYAEGLHQLGVPLEKIKIRWNFLKYVNINIRHMVNVTYKDKENIKTSCIKRNEWVNKIKAQLKKDIKEYNPELSNKELKNIIDLCIENNDINSLPENINNRENIINGYVLSDVIKTGTRYNWVNTPTLLTQLRKDLKEVIDDDSAKIEVLIIDCINENSLKPLRDYLDISNYVLEDAYIYGEVNQDNINLLISEMCKDINEITKKNTDEQCWEIDGIDKSKEYYCNVLCGYKKHCKYYSKYLNELKQYTVEGCLDKQENDDILRELEGII